MCDTTDLVATAGSGSVEYRFLIYWTICSVSGTCGAFVAAAKAQPFPPDLASVTTLRTRACVRSVVDLAAPRDSGATSHSARTMAHNVGHSSDQKRFSLVCRKRSQVDSEALTAGRPRRSQLLSMSTFQADSEAEEGVVVHDRTKNGVVTEGQTCDRLVVGRT